jgi:hypothetical protein
MKIKQASMPAVAAKKGAIPETAPEARSQA